MNFSYCSIILLLFTQVSFANSSVTRELCLKIKTEKDQPDLCERVAASYPGNRTILADNCIYVKNAYLTGMETADDVCKQTFRALSSVADSTEMTYVSPVAVSATGPATRLEIPARISDGMNQCQPKPYNAYACEQGLPVPIPSLEEILNITARFHPPVTNNEPKYTDAACNCFKKQSEKTISEKGVIAFEANIAAEQEKINDIIFQSAGVRILNSIAGNLEDIDFYRTNNTALIGGDEAARKLVCNDVSQYRQKVLRACNSNHVDAKVMEERMSGILSSLGDTTNAETLEEKFATLQNKVLNLDLEKEVDGKKFQFTRASYDNIRFGAATGLPEVNFLNDVTDLFLDHPVLGPELEHSMQVENHNPGRAIFTLLRKEERPEVKEILMKLAKEKKYAGQFANEIIAVLETPNSTDLGTLIEQKVAKTMEMHPSLKALFKDTELFYKVRKATHENGTHSLLAQMEKNPSYMKEYYEERCGKIQDQFAEAVCVPEGNFVDRTNREDLNTLLAPYDVGINENLKDLILCRIPRNQDANSVFQKLAFKKWDKLIESDYWRSKSPEKSANTFLADVRAMVKGGDKKAFAYLGGLSRMGEPYRAPDREYVAAKLKDDPFSLSRAENVAPTAPLVVPEDKREYAGIKMLSQLSENMGGTTEALNSPGLVPGMNDYTSPGPLPPTEIKEKSARNSRSSLRDFLADGENAEEIDRLLSQTKSEDHEELIKLKEELAKNKEMLLQLSTQTEQNKLKALQDRYRELENRDPASNVAQTKPQEESESRSESRSSFVAGNNSIISNSPGDVTSNNNIAPAAQTSGSEGGSGSSSSRAPSSLANARLNPGSSGSDGNFAFSASSPQGEILIEQSIGVIPGQQMAPEELGLVIKKYVEQTELDVQTLKQLKDQEVVIKYKVFENGVEVLKTMTVKSNTLTPETKKFLENQIALKEKEVERNEARRAHSFATLKLLLGIKAKAVY